MALPVLPEGSGLPCAPRRPSRAAHAPWLPRRPSQEAVKRASSRGPPPGSLEVAKANAAEWIGKLGAWRGATQLVPVFPAGDSMVEPFWPQGLGSNRGFHTALDAAWAVRLLRAEGQTETTPEMLQAALLEPYTPLTPPYTRLRRRRCSSLTHLLHPSHPLTPPHTPLHPGGAARAGVRLRLHDALRVALRPAQARGRLECRPGLALLELGAPDIPVHPLTPLKVSRYSNSALLNICRMLLQLLHSCLAS